MYDAKEAGRDRYAVAEGGGADGALGARISWADLIRDALEEDRFVLRRAADRRRRDRADRPVRAAAADGRPERAS